MSTFLFEPVCQCGKSKTVVRYILSPRAKLKLNKRKIGSKRTAEEFTEPHPDGDPVTLLACTDCDEVHEWPRAIPKKSRFRP